MAYIKVFDKNVEAYEAWYETYPEVYESELLALREQFAKLPANLRGIEVGLGTGRFAGPLGIKEGVEPSEAMAERAARRGIETINGIAEKLPYADMQFDFVLFVTICHLNDVHLAFKEAFRVLKRGGAAIVGFLDEEKPIARGYWEKRKQSDFFRNARFYSVHRVVRLLRDAGFRNLGSNQTLFGGLDEITEIQFPKAGTGEGSFVTLIAYKP